MTVRDVYESRSWLWKKTYTRPLADKEIQGLLERARAHDSENTTNLENAAQHIYFSVRETIDRLCHSSVPDYEHYIGPEYQWIILMRNFTKLEGVVSAHSELVSAKAIDETRMRKICRTLVTFDERQLKVLSRAYPLATGNTLETIRRMLTIARSMYPVIDCRKANFRRYWGG